MIHFVPRTCTEIGPNGQRTAGIPLSELRTRPAYVLLGEPGAGKTTSFEMEADESGGKAIPARDFVPLEPRPEWRGKTLFIDGLDEIRAGSTDKRTPFDEIRRKLDLMGRPPFRISCREADWFGASDREYLERVSPSGSVAVFHLDPLSPDQVTQLLANEYGISDPHAFVEHAKKSRLDALLGNPQTLRMLAEAIRDPWPDSLAEIYDLACRKLAEEPNKKHRDAQRSRSPATDDILDSAGHVFAVQLLAGIAGYALDADAADLSYPTFASIGLEVTDSLGRAVGSRLFEAKGSEERREPTHRSVAEYLGARFLAKRLTCEGLPFGRVQALMAAGDGGIVSDLRGLHAWLAVHCPFVRERLIEEDPLGVVLYGDVRSFAPEGKRRVLQALGREAQRYPWFRSQDWTDHPFGALADGSMLPDLRSILVSEVRDAAHESLLDCALEALVHGIPLPELGEPLLTIVRDASHWERNRHKAIDAYRNICSTQLAPLIGLLNDIRIGKIDDPSDELTGMLLRQLYPDHVTASDVVNYLHPANDTHLVGSYLFFWEHIFLDKTKSGDWATLLDQVADNKRRLRFSSDDFHFRRFAGELLVHGLDADGDAASAARLWNWLSVGLDEHQFSRLDREHQERVANWLSARPGTLMALLDIALSDCRSREDPVHCLFDADQRLYGATMPQPVEEWCFRQAASADRQDVRRFLCNKGFLSLVPRLDWTPGLLDTLLDVGTRFPSLQPIVDEWLTCEWETWRQDNARRKADRAKEETDRLNDWRQHFQKHRAAIEAGTAPAGLMHQLAIVYFGRYPEAKGSTPVERIRTFFDDDTGIVLTTLAGLRNTLTRGDLPTVSEILDVATKRQSHYIAEACLAGAEQLFAIAPSELTTLPEDTQSRLVVFRLTHDFDETPSWFLALVSERPATVAEALVAYARAMFKARVPHISGISPLAHDDSYGEVARQAALPLLASFPLRANKDQLSQLASVLAAAIKHADRAALLDTIEAKLSRPSMDKAQRSQWLAAGFALDPVRFETRLAGYVERNQPNALLVASFFEGRLGRLEHIPEFSESAMALLIRLLAPLVSPERPRGAHWVGPELNTAELVRSLIARLAAKATASATEALDDLLSRDQLRPWREELRDRWESQRLVLREANFKRSEASAVVLVLANNAPANAGDLRALLTWHLRDIARNDRDGSGTGYKRYWNVDRYDRPTAPRPENECRNRLLDLLKERLRPTGVDVQAEGQYREHKRADIRASFGGVGGFNVPVEIKRDRHKELWNAVRYQLMANYAVAPGADGNGIYLVFWFGGGREMPAAADGGPPPKSAAELEERLKATLAPVERRRIDIVVADCSPS